MYHIVRSYYVPGYRVEVEWQISDLRFSRIFSTEQFPDILELLREYCEIKTYNTLCDFVFFDVYIDATSSDAAEEMAVEYTKESLLRVISSNDILLFYVKALPVDDRKNIVAISNT